jgi:hypothetical protein
MIMNFYDNSKCEIVLKPSDFEVQEMIKTARELMTMRMNDWILDQLTIEQLETCIDLFKKEIEKRSK